MGLRIYEINPQYINYLSPHAPHLFHNKQPSQNNNRKYIGIILQINNLDYFAPLTSFKPKHSKIKETLDFIKLKDYAVINLNNMFPVPTNQFTYVDINKIKDPHYKALLRAEYRIIKTQQNRIMKNAKIIYQHKLANNNSTKLSQRCNDFSKLEVLCKQFSK